MTAHNGDYSPEAEQKRKMKREKVQRSRIRKRIAEGNASAGEIAAITAWDNGEDWALKKEQTEVEFPQGEREETGGGVWVLVGVGLLAAFVGICAWAGMRE